MVTIKANETERIAPLFTKVEETPVWSCLQGVMGTAWANQKENPTAARIFVGGFLFFAGDSSAEGAEELVKALPPCSRPWRVVVPPDEDWAGLIEAVHKEKAQRTTRYAFYKDTVFDESHLKRLRSSLSEEYRIVPFGEEVYQTSLAEEWSQDFCPHFDSLDDFLARGIGSAVYCGNEMVGGAASYTVYKSGIEIEIDVRKDHRNKGVGTACAADLILRCLETNLHPSWDAANLISVALAQKLGYRLRGDYPAYAVAAEANA